MQKGAGPLRVDELTFALEVCITSFVAGLYPSLDIQYPERWVVRLPVFPQATELGSTLTIFQPLDVVPVEICCDPRRGPRLIEPAVMDFSNQVASTIDLAHHGWLVTEVYGLLDPPNISLSLNRVSCINVYSMNSTDGPYLGELIS